MTDLIHLKTDGAIAEIILNKPARRNALCLTMWRELARLVEQAEANTSVSVIIIHGGDAGAFAAGADISEFEEIYATAEK
ncbi:MAG: enoyl-CoA hydratase-related protein, partial [Pseudomonadota bacterium]